MHFPAAYGEHCVPCAIRVRRQPCLLLVSEAASSVESLAAGAAGSASATPRDRMDLCRLNGSTRPSPGRIWRRAGHESAGWLWRLRRPWRPSASVARPRAEMTSNSPMPRIARYVPCTVYRVLCTVYHVHGTPAAAHHVPYHVPICGMYGVCTRYNVYEHSVSAANVQPAAGRSLAAWRLGLETSNGHGKTTEARTCGRTV